MANKKEIDGWRKVIEGEPVSPNHSIKINQSDYTSLMERLARFEYALEEVINQDGLMAFLDKNEWATSEDYFAHVAKKALQRKL